MKAKKMKGVLAAALVVCLAAAALARPYRILAIGYDGEKGKEPSPEMKALAPEMTHALQDDVKAGAVFDRLAEFDFLFVTPGPHPELAAATPKIKAWIAEGGIVAVGGGGDVSWLAADDPTFALAIPDGGCYQIEAVPAPDAPPTFFGNPVHFDCGKWKGSHWNHLSLPEGSDWKVLSWCRAGKEPLIVWRAHGKGGVFVSLIDQSNTLGAAAMIAGVRFHLPLMAQGLWLVAADVPELAVGMNTLSMTLKNVSDAPKTVTLALNDEKATATVPAGGEKTVTLKAKIAERGVKRFDVTLSCNGATGLYRSGEVRLCDLFETYGTRYRNLLSLDRRYEDVRVTTRVSPIDEDVKGAVVRLTAYDATGKKISETDTPAKAGMVASTVKLPLDLPAGKYRVTSALVARGGKTLGTGEATLEILPRVPGQTMIDEDLNFLVDGEPFFPLGMYHIVSTEYADLADLGVNLVQQFGYDCDYALERAWEQRFRTAFEPWGKPVEQCPAAYDVCPSAMLWYVGDEPSGRAAVESVRAAHERVHRTDPHHPTLICACRFYEFSYQTRVTDVFATDPYPVYVSEGDPAVVGRWMDVAHGFLGDERPMICAIQSHLGESHADWLLMTWLALCHDSRGVMWYCWSQAGGGDLGIGIKARPDHRADLPRVCSELRALAPAFLNEPERKPFVKDRVHGVALRDPETKTRILLLVNPSTNAVAKAAVKWKGVKASTKEAKGAFGYKGFPMKNGVVAVELQPREVRVVYADGPAPVAMTIPPAPKAPSGKSRTLKVGAKARYRTIQAAVDAAKPGDEILVAPGVYKPFTTKNDFLTIRSLKGAAATIIDAKGKGRAATLTVKPYGLMGGETNTVLVGFTLRNGVADKTNFHKHFGGAVVGGTLRDCVVTGSTAKYGGGVAFSRVEKSTIANCRATLSGGGASHALLKDSVVKENTAAFDGGGAAQSTSVGTLFEKNCAERDGGGVIFGSVTGCRFLGNEAGRDGGGARLQGGARLLSSLFDGNRAGRFGGGTAHTTVEHATYVNNSAAEGGAACSWESTVSKSILWGNSATKAGTEEFAGNLAKLVGNCVKWTRTEALPNGCIADDPKFIGKDDCRLQKDSPCIDMGEGVCATGESDAGGKPRRLGRVTDAGAYECGGKPHAPWLDEKIELVRWTPGEDKTTGVKRDVKLPAGRETTDLRIKCRFKCEQTSKRGVLARFESGTGLILDLEVGADGLLKGGVRHATLMGNADPSSGAWYSAFQKASTGVRVDDGQWHEAVFTFHALDADAALSELTLDGKVQPVACLWPGWNGWRGALRTADGTLAIEPSAGELAEVVFEALPTPAKQR